MREIKPLAGKLDAKVRAPASKSYTNRALLIAALAPGESKIMNSLESDDTKYMASALAHLGVYVKRVGDTFVVRGLGGAFEAPEEELFLGNAGTAMRFLATASALVKKGMVVLKGNERMCERPVGDLLSALAEIGVSACSMCGNGCPPVLVRGGGIPGGTCTLKGDKSSQFFTSVMISAPYAQEDVTIECDGDLVSKPYIDMTVSSMREFGVNVENDNYRRFTIRAGKKYFARDYMVEGDFSSASYFFAAAAICGGSVSVSGLNPNSAQGDKDLIDVLSRMGCSVSWDKNTVTVTGPEVLVAPGEVDMNSMPDVAMTLAVVASFARGETRIVNASNLRIKECDRIRATVTELRKMGVDARELPDGMVIIGGAGHHKAAIDAYDDHRIAMSFAVAGLRVPGISIRDEKCVSKTFPDFFEVLEGLGAGDGSRGVDLACHVNHNQ